jgi:long-chain acyl-CoA synthetase
MTKTARPVLITGATGFVGMELLVRILEQTDRDVIALVRGCDNEAAQRRMDEVLATLLSPADRPRRGRVRALAADLTTPGLGLSAIARDRLAASIGAIVHCAASISFSLELEEARHINVDGTRAILELAEQAHEHGALDRFVHVSTAYVAGEQDRCVSEDDGDLGQGFRNTYERTKLEAEEVVRASAVPTAILRPSVIVGDSATGWTPSFNVIYFPLQAFARGLFPNVPGDADARLDIVPVDTVADALLELLCGPVREGAFHVVAGDTAPTNTELATLAAEAFDAEPPVFVGPGEDEAAENRAGALVPYFRVRCTFDATRGRALGATPPPLASYFPTLMRYAREARWGKDPIPRWALAERGMQRVA